MSPRANAGNVAFDFEGSLQLARTLWGLAEDLASAHAKRQAAAQNALRDWRGTYGQEFGSRQNDEAASHSHVAAALQEEARGWALAWKLAMDEQSDRLRQREVERRRAQRGFWEQVGDVFVGDDTEQQVAPAAEFSVPQPPAFHATGSLARY